MDFTKKKVITESDINRLEVIDIDFNIKAEIVTVAYREHSNDNETKGRIWQAKYYDTNYSGMAACLDLVAFKKYLDDNKLWEKYDLGKGESPSLGVTP